MDADVVVIGAGLSGCLVAVFLARQGRQVVILEGREDPRSTHRLGLLGRSINLALSTRALTALHAAELDQKVRQMAVPMYARCVHLPSGEIQVQPYGRPDQCLWSVSRHALNALLLHAAEGEPGVELRFRSKVDHVELERGEAFLESGECIRSRLMVGADGIWSRVRAAISRHGRLDFHQRYIDAAYKELRIPRSAEGSGSGFRLSHPECLHIWPRHRFMLIALPNLDGSFSCTLFMDLLGPWPSFEAVQSEADVLRLFHENFPDVLERMPELLTDWAINPTTNLLTVKCRPYHYHDRAVLVGDAAHALGEQWRGRKNRVSSSRELTVKYGQFPFTGKESMPVSKTAESLRS